MLDAYANTSVAWKQKTGTNFDGSPKYGDSISIMGRVQYKRRLVRDNTGKEVVSEITVYTKSLVSIGDLVTLDKDYITINVSTHTDINGQEVFREVLM